MERDILELIALGIDKYAIEKDENGSITVRQSINWEGKLINGIIPVKLKQVYGDFNISNNKLRTIENCPEFIAGTFICSRNYFESFKGGPKYCRILQCNFVPELMDLSHAPFVQMEVNGQMEQTRVVTEALQIYKFACRKGIWSAQESWDENIIRLYAAYPSKCMTWNLINQYYFENRGGSLGENLNIL